MILSVLAAMTASVSAESLFSNRSYDAEQALNQWSQKALFGYGFEYNYEISHFFQLSGDAVPTASQKNNIQTESVKHFSSLPPAILKELYYEFYSNNIALNYLIRYYKDRKDWVNYNHLVKKIEPETKKYFSILEGYVSSDQRCSDFAHDAEALKVLWRQTILIQQERLNTIENFR